jgi:hypothetical protein
LAVHKYWSIAYSCEGFYWSASSFRSEIWKGLNPFALKESGVSQQLCSSNCSLSAATVNSNLFKQGFFLPLRSEN